MKKVVSNTVTIRDVAEAAGVSISLVSFVLNAKRGPKGEYICSASQETAEKIVAAAKKLGYRKNMAASSLRSGYSKTLGIIVADIANTFFSDICRHLENISAQAGYLSIFGSTDDNPEKMSQLINKFIASGVDGLIVAPCAHTEQQISEIAANVVPVVLIDRDLASAKGVGRVMMDNENAGRQATRHLIGNGHKKIEMIRYQTDIPTILKRFQGYKDEMFDNGLGQYVKDNIIRKESVDEGMIDAVREARERGVNALIFPSNLLTIKGIAAINNLGYKIPDDFAVVGFDQGDNAEIYNPKLSYVYQPTKLVAQHSFEMLHNMITGQQGSMCKTIAPKFVLGLSSASSQSGRTGSILLCGSSFDNLGGWISDSQFMDVMGSSYLLAHGLGKPVDDASTSFFVEKEGEYHIYVRTRNWTAYWSDSAPGIFNLSIDSVPIENTFGSGSAEWNWQEGGTVHLSKGNHIISVHDLTGFEGRFDSILLTLHPGAPVEDINTLRKRLLDIPVLPEDKGTFDFVVAGGGVAGMCAALSAARLGHKVALIQDRKVLGGNNSSEVRVGLGGRINIGPFPALGYLLNEFAPSRKGNARPADIYEDEKKLDIILKEKNISLFLGYKVSSVDKSDSSIISSVIATNVDDYRTIKVSGHFFADCTGDATLGVLAGAEWSMGREAKSEYDEPSAPETADGITLGASVLWYSEEENEKQIFPDIDWGLKIDEDTVQKVRRGQWYWEVGMKDDQIADAEKIRDYGMYVAYSNWAYIKNHSSFKGEYDKTALKWLSFYAGKRESRRLIGEFVLKEQDLRNFTIYDDGCVSTSWYIDNHEPDPENQKRFKDPWLSRGCLAPLDFYPIPFRCFYSKNVLNLFMAGRNISVSHLALGTTRVMRTCAMMGEVVGMACSVCLKNNILPSKIVPSFFDELKALMKKGVGDPNKPYTQIYTLIDTTAVRSEDC
ncbi:MAG: FAD-dependent oxidoreductase [Bacteroidales bacterium]|jgi:DNA-binding LacI/PurR family transcriptional regulator|nr:FAD-dependent oxidoreductase [Bacteroidota bacterium]NLN99324.1 FAD-dependent oxidoreductase [Bacteroidales bacterium]